MAVPANSQSSDAADPTRSPAGDPVFSQLAARAEELSLGTLRLDVGETFRNRFVLVWHDRQASFSPEDEAADEYQVFWRDFARTVCAEGPRVDDTLHLFPSETSGEGTFWVVGGDGRMASHCANGLLYAGHRWQEVHGIAKVRLQCGRDARHIEMLAGAVRVNLGRPQLLENTRMNQLQLSTLGNPPLCVDTGEPHAVGLAEDLIGVADPFGEDFVHLGKDICASWSEAGINWNLVSVAPEGLRIRTFERGVRRPTDSCGTGSAAAFFVAREKGRWQGLEADVISPGGRHRVSLRDDDVWLQGSPTHHRTMLLREFVAQVPLAWTLID